MTSTVMQHSLIFVWTYICFVFRFARISSLRYAPQFSPSLQLHDHRFIPDKVLRISAQEIPYDCTVRYSVVVNGTIPGPELRFKEGDRAWIRVYNDMTDQNTTIHWHGLTQRMSPFSDGTPGSTQWPIPPLHYFDYEFQLSEGDAGTYFYHSHVGFQAVTAFGAFIVEESANSKPPFQYDDERTLLISDIFYLNDSYIEAGLMQQPFRFSGEVDNIALNGKSRAPTANFDQFGPACQYAVITLEPERVYRIRVIGATALSQIYIAFEEHMYLAIIEVDGRYVEPVSVDHLEVSNGQRYSVLLKSKSRSELAALAGEGRKQFWIEMESRSRAVVTTAYAVLTYSEILPAPDLFSLPATKPIESFVETFANDWLEEQFKPLRMAEEGPVPRAEEVTRRVIIDIHQIHYSGLTNGTVALGLVNWVQSQYSWFDHTPRPPYLVSLYRNLNKFFPNYERALTNYGFDPVTKTFPAKIGEVLEVVWQNMGKNVTNSVETHPMHAHGDHFFDIGTGYGRYNPEFAEELLRARNYSVITRDTTNLYRTPPPQPTSRDEVYSWRAWRIRVQSAGVWMMHCHTLQHTVMGMQTLWIFGEPAELTALPKHLANGYLTFGGAAYGNSSYTPQVLHYWHD